jgi:predicted nucleic acid-binding protein
MNWFNAEVTDWATCAIAENGFLRIISHPAYPAPVSGVEAAMGLLAEQYVVAGWRFWGDDVSILDVLEPGVAITHSQITDLYLLGLAAHKGGRLATLDSRINASAVRGGREAFFVIPVG